MYEFIRGQIYFENSHLRNNLKKRRKNSQIKEEKQKTNDFIAKQIVLIILLQRVRNR